MNGLAFLQLLIEAYKTELTMFSKDGVVYIKINGAQWEGHTLDQCVSSIKQSLAIKYLEENK